MNYLSVTFVLAGTVYFATGEKCRIDCPSENTKMVCGYNQKDVTYKMFPSQCAMDAHKNCYGTEYTETPLEFCIKHHNTVVEGRRSYGESCPVFCPSHYRPVCGASQFRSYQYRTFNNGCFLDMINCRGDEDFDGFVEVPLEYCQKHLMKNIFKEKVYFSGLHNDRDYE